MTCKRLFILTLAILSLLIFTGISVASEVALTSIGQSPDAMMVKVVMKKIRVEVECEPMLMAQDLASQKVLVAVVGGSSKGLGAAGINKEEENERARALLTSAAEKGIRILVMHVGGAGRRGQLSDLFIKTAVPFAEELIIVQGANEDGLFDELIEGKQIQIREAPNVVGTSVPLKEVLLSWGIQVP